MRFGDTSAPGAPDYRTYIRSDEWKLRRVAALHRATRRDGYVPQPRCEVCGRAGYPHKNSGSSLDYRERRFRVEHSNGLEVHHLHYRNLGHEEPADLMVLCTDNVIMYRFNYDAWRDECRKAKEEGRPTPELPTRAGCHERVHDDPAFKREVLRIAAERDAQ